jgi:hypothetical protein
MGRRPDGNRYRTRDLTRNESFRQIFTTSESVLSAASASATAPSNQQSGQQSSGDGPPGGSAWWGCTVCQYGKGSSGTAHAIMEFVVVRPRALHPQLPQHAPCRTPDPTLRVGACTPLRSAPRAACAQAPPRRAAAPPTASHVPSTAPPRSAPRRCVPVPSPPAAAPCRRVWSRGASRRRRA